MMLAEVSKHFSHAMVVENVVMPNHVHLILVLNDIRKFAGDGEMMVDWIRLDVGPCHGMALRATDDGTVIGLKSNRTITCYELWIRKIFLTTSCFGVVLHYFYICLAIMIMKIEYYQAGPR